MHGSEGGVRRRVAQSGVDTASGSYPTDSGAAARVCQVAVPQPARSRPGSGLPFAKGSAQLCRRSTLVPGDVPGGGRPQVSVGDSHHVSVPGINALSGHYPMFGLVQSRVTDRPVEAPRRSVVVHGPRQWLAGLLGGGGNAIHPPRRAEWAYLWSRRPARYCRDSPFPTAPPRTGLATFTASGSPVVGDLRRVGFWHHTYLHAYSLTPSTCLPSPCRWLSHPRTTTEAPFP